MTLLQTLQHLPHAVCVGCRKRFKPSTIRALHIALNGSFTLSGIAGAATAGYTLHIDNQYKDLVSDDAARVVLYCALLSAAFSGVGCVGAFRRSRCVLGAFLLVLLVVILAQIALAATVAWWIDVAYASKPAHGPIDTDVTSPVETGDETVDAYVSVAFSELEGYGCNLYRTCCMKAERFLEANGTHTSEPFLEANDTHTSEALLEANDTHVLEPLLEANGHTCTTAHNGATVGAAAALRHDPSGPTFCRIQTGSAVTSRAPPAFAQCLALQEAGVLVLDECVADFCAAGLTGYHRFMGDLLAWLRHQAGWMVLGTAVLIVLQVLSLVLTWILLFFSTSSQSGQPDGPPTDRTGLLGSGAGADTAEDSRNIELSERIDIRSESVSVADPQLSEERAKFKRKIQQQLASLEQP
jgi:hypothetical protein